MSRRQALRCPSCGADRAAAAFVARRIQECEQTLDVIGQNAAGDLVLAPTGHDVVATRAGVELTCGRCGHRWSTARAVDVWPSRQGPLFVGAV